MLDYLLDDPALSLRDEVRSFVKSIPRQLLLDMDQDNIRFPKTFLQEAGRRHLMGCRYAPENGGRGLNWLATAMVMEEIGTLGYMMACVFGVGAELVCDAIIQHGTASQIDTFVRPLLKGERFAAECLTEPRGGSDFFGTTTTARSDGDDFIISGQKRFIVGAEGADFFLVYARTAPDNPPHQALTCFIVERGPGVKTEYLYGLMGCRGGGTGRLVFDDVRVPRRHIVGDLNGAHDVFNTMMIPERLGTAAMTVGAARPAVEIAGRYTTRRKAFGQPINRFQGVSFQIAEAVTLLDAARAMITATCQGIDAGVGVNRCRRLVSQTKKFTAESCQQAVHHAMQVMGGIGYTNIYPIERIFRDLRLASIWTGTNEVMAAIIANEWYREQAAAGKSVRNSEQDAPEAGARDEKIFS